ncbi:MAG: hypothetical protein V1859_01535 [archaeon]
MNRKSQVTIFVILGMVVVLGIVFLLYNNSKQKETVLAQGQNRAFSATHDSISMFIENCVKQTTIDGILEYGLDPLWSKTNIENHILGNIDDCLNEFNDFKDQGFDVTVGTMAVNVEITDETVLVTLKYPVTLTRQDGEFKFDIHTYTFQRTVLVPFVQNSLTDTFVTSEDGSLTVRIPAGTSATLNGNPVDKVGIKLLEKNFEDLENDVVPGMVAFEGLPSGTEFSNEIELTMFYDDNDIPISFNENDIRIGYYDREHLIWYGLPTTVDAENNKLTVMSRHFSPYDAVVNCDTKITKEWTTPILVRNDAMPCADVWKDGQSIDIDLYKSNLPSVTLWTVAPVTGVYAFGDIQNFAPSTNAQFYETPYPAHGYHVFVKDVAGAGNHDNCAVNKCRECINDHNTANTGDDSLDYCFADSCNTGHGCPSSTSDKKDNLLCEDGATSDDFPYICKQIFSYELAESDTDAPGRNIIRGISYLYAVQLDSKGKSCIPIEFVDAPANFFKAVETSLNKNKNAGINKEGKGDEKYYVVPTCDVGQKCKILDPDIETVLPSLGTSIKGVQLAVSVDRSPILRFKVQAENIPPNVCFESAATIYLKGIGMSEGYYQCDNSQNGNIDFIKGQCMKCNAMLASEGKWVPSDDCFKGGCLPALAGLVRMDEERNECEMCVYENTLYKWVSVELEQCARCETPTEKTLPRCISNVKLPETCGDKYSTPDKTSADCTDTCHCSGNYDGQQLGPVGSGAGVGCPNPNAQVCCRCADVTNGQCAASTEGSYATCEADCIDGIKIGYGPLDGCQTSEKPFCCQKTIVEACSSGGTYDSAYAHADCVSLCGCSGTSTTGGVPLGVISIGGENCPNPSRDVCCRCDSSRPKIRAECKAFDGKNSECTNNGCAYYQCRERCWPVGTDEATACPPRTTREECSVFDTNDNQCSITPNCAYYGCSKKCWPKNTANNVACPSATPTPTTTPTLPNPGLPTA